MKNKENFQGNPSVLSVTNAAIEVKRSNKDIGSSLEAEIEIQTNDANYKLVADTNDDENTDTGRINLLSNGFKITTTGAGLNTDGSYYIYMAFGQPIVGCNGVVGTAR